MKNVASQTDQWTKTHAFAESLDLTFSSDLNNVNDDKFSSYAIHVLCRKGTFSFKMSDQLFDIKKNDLVIWTHGSLVSDIITSDDLDVIVLYVSYQFVRNNSPHNDYDIIGNLALLQNPVLVLSEKDKTVCENDLKQIETRLRNVSHRFYHEQLGCSVVSFFLDLYDIHVRTYIESPISKQNAILLRRFIDLLSTEEYIKNREVAQYAALLFVTPKYLSEVCKKVSGRSATFWIERFTITEITRKLRDKRLNLTEIADDMNFSSISYFSRYVQRILGVSPSEFRKRLDIVRE